MRSSLLSIFISHPSLSLSCTYTGLFKLGEQIYDGALQPNNFGVSKILCDVLMSPTLDLELQQGKMY